MLPNFLASDSISVELLELSVILQYSLFPPPWKKLRLSSYLWWLQGPILFSSSNFILKPMDPFCFCLDSILYINYNLRNWWILEWRKKIRWEEKNTRVKDWKSPESINKMVISLHTAFWQECLISNEFYCCTKGTSDLEENNSFDLSLYNTIQIVFLFLSPLKQK